MTDERQFLATIKASPADDAPRLVYADWLDERGRHDQAEIIRVEYACRQAQAKLADSRTALTSTGVSSFSNQGDWFFSGIQQIRKSRSSSSSGR